MSWMKYRFLYFALSLLVIIPGTYSLIRYGLKLGVDFSGGSTIRLSTTPSDTDKLVNEFRDVQSIRDFKVENNSVAFTTDPIDQKRMSEIETALKTKFEKVGVESFLTVGPSVGADMIRKTLSGIALATAVILLFVAKAFKSIKFGVCAILAMFHDSLILIGSFSLLGHFFGVEVDLLFVTAVLTILSFSVHDTIVVYDRIRELKRRNPNNSLSEVADMSVSQTLVRSLNNSLTIIFMLLALVLLGGPTIHYFALALLIGTITGTYSSTFTATPLLVVLDDLTRKR